jgi:hypothetical protein
VLPDDLRPVFREGGAELDAMRRLVNEVENVSSR